MPPQKVPTKQRQARTKVVPRFHPYADPQRLSAPTPNHQAHDAQSLQDRYGVCNDDSVFHDLECGHRIEVERDAYTTSCGTNCVASSYRKPFACPQCITADVQLAMTLKGLSLSVDKTMATAREQIDRDADIMTIANNKIAEARGRGECMCKAAEKFDDPTLQFFDSFLREEGFEGIDPAEAKTVASPPEQQIIRPSLAPAHVPALGIANGKKRKLNTTSITPALFRPFGNSGTDYTPHGKIASRPDASSQYITVHKRRKTYVPDPSQPRNQLKDSAWRYRDRVKKTNATLPRTPNPPSSLTATPTSATSTPAQAVEDDASKAVRLAMAAVELDELHGINAS